MSKIFSAEVTAVATVALAVRGHAAGGGLAGGGRVRRKGPGKQTPRTSRDHFGFGLPLKLFSSGCVRIERRAHLA